MLVAQISDTHVLAPGSGHPAVSLRAACLRMCVSDINELRPDAVIFTGDTVQSGSQEEYEYLRDLLEPLNAPLYVVPGNRDNKKILRSVLGEQFSRCKGNDFLQYAVEEHDLRLVALDSTNPGERKGVFCSTRQDWLDRVLEEQPDRPTLLFVHHPPFDVGDHYVGGYRRDEDVVALHEILDRHRQVRGLFCGHVHWPVVCEWGGAAARVMPSVAIDLRNGVDETENEGHPVYMCHTWSEDSGFVSQLRAVAARV